MEVFNDQLYAALAALLDGEALDILMNTTEGNGLEAWRKITKRFDPKTKGRIRGNLMQLLAPPQCNINELSSKIEQWEESARRHEETARKPVDEGIRVASLNSMFLKIPQDHIGLNQNRLIKYEDVRNEIYSFLENRQDFHHNSQRPTPMDLGSWDYDKGKGGKFGGKKGGDS